MYLARTDDGRGFLSLSGFGDACPDRPDPALPGRLVALLLVFFVSFVIFARVFNTTRRCFAFDEHSGASKKPLSWKALMNACASRQHHPVSCRR